MKTSLLTTGLPIDFAAPNLQPQARGDASTSFADNLRSAAEGYVAPGEPSPAPSPAPQGGTPAPSQQQRAERRDERSDARRDERNDRRAERRPDTQGVERRDARRDVRRDERDDHRDTRRAARRERRHELVKDDTKQHAAPGVDAGASNDELAQALRDANTAAAVDPTPAPAAPAEVMPGDATQAADETAARMAAETAAASAEPASALFAQALRPLLQTSPNADTTAFATSGGVDVRAAALDTALPGTAQVAQPRGRHGTHAAVTSGAATSNGASRHDPSLDAGFAMPQADVNVADVEAPRTSARHARSARAGDGDATRRGAQAEVAPAAGHAADRAATPSDVPTALWRDAFQAMPTAFASGGGTAATAAHAGSALSALGAMSAAAGGSATWAASASGSVPEHTIAAPPGSADFTRALSSQVTMWARDGTQEARLQLNPADLGPVTVMIAIDGAQARVDFQAHAAATRDAIEASLPSLANALSEQGLTLAGGGVFDRPGRDAQAQQTQQAQRQTGPGRDDAETEADDTMHRGANAASRVVASRGLVDLVA